MKARVNLTVRVRVRVRVRVGAGHGQRKERPTRRMCVRRPSGGCSPCHDLKIATSLSGGFSLVKTYSCF